MKEIQLTQGQVALVDDEDYEELSKYKWFAHKHRNTYYVHRNSSRKNPPRKLISMHRIVMNAQPEQQVDHINGDGLDNRKENLRFCTNSQNQWNRHATYGTSIYKGVSWSNPHNKWVAQIKHKGSVFYLGAFEDDISAARAYNEAAIKLFGEFAKLNSL